MRKGKNLKTIGFKFQVILVLGLTLVFALTGALIVRVTRAHYVDLATGEAIRLAQSYGQSLVNGERALGLINALMEDKLLAASGVVALDPANRTDSRLGELAQMLAIDKIYVYDEDLVIRHSNDGEYIGWTPEPGHPVESFMKSGQESLVEEIRPDSESGILYKYGYFRTPDGGMVQIGIYAQQVEDYRKTFEVEGLLQAMLDNEYVDVMGYFDRWGYLTSLANEAVLRSYLTDQAWHALALDQRHVDLQIHDDHEDLVLIEPVFDRGTRVGTLVIGHSMEETQDLIFRLSMIGLGALLAIYALLLTTLSLTYKNNRELTRYAYYDGETGLPNLRHLKRAIDQQEGEVFHQQALVLIQSRNFGWLNLTYGHQYSQDLLKATIESLQKVLEPRERLHLLSEGNLAILVEGYENKAALALLVHRLFQILEDMHLARRLGLVMGIAEKETPAITMEALLKRAGLAASAVPGGQAQGYRFYDETMEVPISREKSIEAHLQRVLRGEHKEDLCLVYQPILDLKRNRLFGFEALARLHHEELGWISPLEFIVVAEKRGLMPELGMELFKRAIAFIKRIQKQGNRSLKVEVNISPLQLFEENFVPSMIRLLQDQGIEPQSLGIEVTESVFMDGFESINGKLQQLRDYGITVAVDDFGSGYSSLAREQELTVDLLKMDKSFVDKLLSPEAGRAIIGDVIVMAHRMGHQVVAEGVEEASQKDYLVRHHCDLLQGYHYSRPLAEEAALVFITQNP